MTLITNKETIKELRARKKFGCENTHEEELLKEGFEGINQDFDLWNNLDKLNPFERWVTLKGYRQAKEETLKDMKFLIKVAEDGIDNDEEEEIFQMLKLQINSKEEQEKN